MKYLVQIVVMCTYVGETGENLTKRLKERIHS